MAALVYLIRTRIKNRLLAIVKSPGSLIGLLLIVAFMGWLFMMPRHSAGVGRNIQELYAIVLVYLAFIFIQTAKGGVGRGVSLFKMPDVNLMFTAPISSRRILFYGLVQQIGTSAMMGLVMLAQYGWMRNVYGIGVPFMAGLVVGYAVTLFLGQLTAMVLYVFVSGNAKRRRMATAVLAGLCLVSVAYILLHVLGGMSDPLGSAVSAASGLPLSLFPVAGWMRAMIAAVNEGAMGVALLSILATGVYVAAMAVWMTRMQPDYYEDVLQSTERSYSAVLAAKEGKTAEAMPENIKLGKTGIGRGKGASVFFYKQLLESRRARRFPLDTVSLMMLAVGIGFAFFVREDGLLPALIFGAYMMIFSVATGRWVRELLLPYVYRVPASAFQKLVYCLMESFRSLGLEAVLYGAGLWLILGLTPIEALCVVFFRWSFGVLLTCGMVLAERMFTQLRAKWLIMILLILLDMLLAAPGIALAIWVRVAMPGFLSGNLVMTLIPAVANFLVAAFAIFLSRNVLEFAELNNA